MYKRQTLFSALMIGATGTFTSCKDYDDDIKNLQEQLGKKASLEELAAKVSDVYKRQGYAPEHEHEYEENPCSLLCVWERPSLQAPFRLPYQAADGGCL